MFLSRRDLDRGLDRVGEEHGLHENIGSRLLKDGHRVAHHWAAPRSRAGPPA